jgi:AcrR family transcriptional regulator
MSIQTRRERERAEREQLIVTAARELAEAEGWDAVTTRRLAAEIEYSQPVLYSHFKGKEAIMAAAVQGFEELAGELYAARTSAPSPRDALGAVGRAYADFCERRPALYDVMFTLTVDLPFATPEAPAPLRAAFGELHLAMAPLATDEDPGVLTETVWAAPHGLLTLMRSGRLRREQHDRRLALLISRFCPPDK